MNTAEQLGRLQHWRDTHPVAGPIVRDPATYEDEDTLRRSRIAPVQSSPTYRRAADMPREPWMDSLAVATGDYREEWS